ncbi:MAG: hypothetical protein EBU88_03010 [Acidobacteria bacterium]|nr:hypothetical protein [Acidobacteriota bacterium]
MCNQTVGLVQAAIEREGIATVSVTLLREVSEVISPPRSLFVPYPLGYPLGEPKNSHIQHRIINSALSLLKRSDVPLIVEFNPADGDTPSGDSS